MNTRILSPGWQLSQLDSHWYPVKKTTPSPPRSVVLGADWQDRRDLEVFCDCSCCCLIFKANGIPLPLSSYHLYLLLISVIVLMLSNLRKVSHLITKKNCNNLPGIEGQMKHWSSWLWWQILSARGSCHFAASWVHGAPSEALLNATAKISAGKKKSPSLNRYL